MEEKYMVNDILDSIKNSLTTYEGVITECANIQLRQTIQQLRNEAESFQYEVFKVAQAKGYYTPAQIANPNDISNVKNQVTQ